MGLIHFSPVLRVAFQTETSHQMTGFYMEFNTVLNGLKSKIRKLKWHQSVQSSYDEHAKHEHFYGQFYYFLCKSVNKFQYCWIESCFCVLGMSGRDKSLRFYMEAILIQKEVKRNKNGLRKIFKYLNSFPP